MIGIYHITDRVVMHYYKYIITLININYLGVKHNAT